ncbi:MAG: T9SS type A sorting domain-containing protein, partial [Candidatus Latescibacteria bacterium]|nr:T9SS type A sorting domain-containing protein [Candidatus Latescibacterota bacterium]
DKPGTNFNSGIGMESWVTRTLDNLSVTHAGLHIIEGIYGRDGQGNGDMGPNPVGQEHDFNSTGSSSTGKAWDWMSNIIIFGKDPYRVDIIGYWLGGHEPGNIGLFHCAIDRGMSTALDPKKVPVYLWEEDGSATLVDLETLERTPLLTYYLCRNYNGQEEPIYHLCDEPFDYSVVTGVEEPAVPVRPKAMLLNQNFPNPFNPYTAISYSIPKGGNVRLEVYNMAGQLVDVLADGRRMAGTHMAVWNTGNHAAGTYFYRLSFGGFSETRKMVLVK